MEGYTKDEINFHGFLTAMRQLQGVTLEQVCEGLCSVSMMKRIESGERLPDKLMRDRLMLRMGVALEGYEDYLSTEEYEEWQIRQGLIKAIKEKELKRARNYLEKYRKKVNCSAVEKQFFGAMDFMLLQMENAPIEQQKAVMKKAVKLTIPDMERALERKVLLSEQEINLLSEYLWLHRDAEKSGTEEAYFYQYERLLAYIDTSLMDDNGRAKTYPKAAFYLCRRILDGYSTLENLQKGLKVCHRAIEVLRKSEKAYYFIELLEVWQELVEKIRIFLSEIGRDKAIEALLVQAKERHEWERLLKELYAEYNVPVYMENFCYLYWETESYCIGDVIRIRRNMLGMTKEQLCEGICSVKTLTRMELKKAKTQLPIVRALFERLGLCAEYTRARVITNDYETLKLADRLAWYVNNDKMEEWEKTLKKLEKKLCMEILQNKQFIVSGYYLLGLRTGELDKEEFVNRMLSTLEYTIPAEAVLKSGKKFLTRDEAQYIFNVGMYIGSDKRKIYLQVVEEICQDFKTAGGIGAHINRYEFFLTGLCSYWGDMGEYEMSNRRGINLIKESLTYQRIGLVAANIYNCFWNNQQIQPTKEKKCSEEEKKLRQCILLSRIHRTKKYTMFYQNILENYLKE